MKKTISNKLFGFIKKVLAITCLVSSVNSLECISMKNQECEVREVIINNECMIYPFSIKVNTSHGSCNNISNPYSRVCVPNIFKNITVKVFDLMSQKNKTKQIKWHENCKCDCRLNPIIWNNKQKWNKDKCRCECLINKNCDNKFAWNPKNCKCEYKKKRALSVEECEDIIDNKAITIKKYNKTVSIKENTSLVSSWKLFVASSIFFLLVSIVTVGAFIYFYVSLQPKRKSQDYY